MYLPLQLVYWGARPFTLKPVEATSPSIGYTGTIVPGEYIPHPNTSSPPEEPLALVQLPSPAFVTPSQSSLTSSENPLSPLIPLHEDCVVAFQPDYIHQEYNLSFTLPSKLQSHTTGEHNYFGNALGISSESDELLSQSNPPKHFQLRGQLQSHLSADSTVTPEFFSPSHHLLPYNWDRVREEGKQMRQTLRRRKDPTPYLRKSYYQPSNHKPYTGSSQAHTPLSLLELPSPSSVPRAYPPIPQFNSPYTTPYFDSSAANTLDLGFNIEPYFPPPYSEEETAESYLSLVGFGQ